MFGQLGQLASLMKNLPKIREEVDKLQGIISRIVGEGDAGGGMVKAKVNGHMEVLRCEISDELMKLNDREMLEDLLRGALNQAIKKAKQAVAEETGKMAMGLGLPPGMSLPVQNRPLLRADWRKLEWMVAEQSGVIARLCLNLGKLPGIGPKSAERLTHYLLAADRQEVLDLSDALRAIKEQIGRCRQCCNLTESELCSLCRDPKRDASLICVVEQPRDLAALERTASYRGLYHVLHGKSGAS